MIVGHNFGWMWTVHEEKNKDRSFSFEGVASPTLIPPDPWDG